MQGVDDGAGDGEGNDLRGSPGSCAGRGSSLHLESHQRVMNQAATIVRKMIPMKNNWNDKIPEPKMGDDGGCKT
jgi:hypothetical protein